MTEDWSPKIREATADEIATYVRECSIAVRRPHKTPVALWRELHRHEVDAYLAASRVNVVDAGGGVLIGFSVVGRGRCAGTVWMLAVKRGFRGVGLGLKLLREQGIPMEPIVAHRPTACWRRWCERHGLRFRGA